MWVIWMLRNRREEARVIKKFSALSGGKFSVLLSADSSRRHMAKVIISPSRKKNAGL
jgi:hypothetical protein